MIDFSWTGRSSSAVQRFAPMHLCRTQKGTATWPSSVANRRWFVPAQRCVFVRLLVWLNVESSPPSRFLTTTHDDSAHGVVREIDGASSLMCLSPESLATTRRNVLHRAQQHRRTAPALPRWRLRYKCSQHLRTGSTARCGSMAEWSARRRTHFDEVFNAGVGLGGGAVPCRRASANRRDAGSFSACRPPAHRRNHRSRCWPCAHRRIGRNHRSRCWPCANGSDDRGSHGRACGDDPRSDIHDARAGTRKSVQPLRAKGAAAAPHTNVRLLGRRSRKHSCARRDPRSVRAATAVPDSDDARAKATTLL